MECCPIGGRLPDASVSAYRLRDGNRYHFFVGSPSIHFNVHRFVKGCGIRVQDNSNFAAVDIVVEKSDADVAIIAKLGGSAVEIDPIQLGAMSKISSVIKEDGNTARKASGAHPAQCAVCIDDGR